jgi:4-hydroxythreonine-4-phosphate dehydrogenase
VIAVADPELLRERAAILGLDLKLLPIAPDTPRQPHARGHLRIWPVPLARRAQAGVLDPANSRALLDALDLATDACRNGSADALVTGPLQKSVINDAGIAFTGHTEYLAARCGAARPVMLLVAGSLRVALVTTHLPLRAVADAISTAGIVESARILAHHLQQHFGLAQPRILVCGLNPHAGESGHLGDEEQRVIEPALAQLRAAGLDVRGPLPADTVFTPQWLQQADAVLAMYHDQGLPTLKHAGFGKAVNVTLGLPIIRTSVDHGTALTLAGSGQADTGSFTAAMDLAMDLAAQRRTAI